MTTPYPQSDGHAAACSLSGGWRLVLFLHTFYGHAAKEKSVDCKGSGESFSPTANLLSPEDDGAITAKALGIGPSHLRCHG